jgi:hypothetical protein
MRRWWSYAGVSGALLAGLVAALWGMLDSEGRSGILWAAGVAWLVQGVAFGMVVGLRDRKQGLLLAMAGGTAARLGALGAAGIVVTVVETGVGAGALLLGLAGFLFVLVLLEALFLRSAETGRSG